jgi:hypothetical protein
MWLHLAASRLLLATDRAERPRCKRHLRRDPRVEPRHRPLHKRGSITVLGSVMLLSDNVRGALENAANILGG